MKSPAQKLHETLKRHCAAYAVEFDMTVYEGLGVMTIATLELWYEHDQESIGEDFDEDE